MERPCNPPQDAAVRASAESGEDSTDASRASLQPMLCPDDSYRGTSLVEFDASHGEGVKAFDKFVTLRANSGEDGCPGDERVAPSSGDLMAMWSNAVSANGVCPSDFGFLRDSSNLRSRSQSQGRTPRSGQEEDAMTPRTGGEADPSSGPAQSSNGMLPSDFGFLNDSSNSNRRRARSPSIGNQRKKKDARIADKADKTIMCKFFLKKSCARKDCSFAHSEAEQREACKLILCRFEAKGACRAGVNCWYRHSISEVTSSPASSSFPPDVNGTEPPFIASSENLKQDKTLMCKFWIKRRCKATDCKFAHSEKEQREACKKHRCRFDLAGKCSQGTRCWFLHGSDLDSEKPSPMEGESATLVKVIDPPSESTLEVEDAGVVAEDEIGMTAEKRYRKESWADQSVSSDDDFDPRLR